MNNVATQILLVEGQDDLHVIRALCLKHQIPEVFRIVECKGVDEEMKTIEKLCGTIDYRLCQSELKTLGIVIDADQNIANRWESIRNKFSEKEYKFPVVIPPEGFIFEPEDDEKIRVGVWIMPNNVLPGMLEDFMLFLIGDGEKECQLHKKAKTILDDIEQENLNGYKIDLHRSKAEIHTFLAWQKDPGTPLGLAITKKYLTATPSIAEKFLNWLKNLYRTAV